MWEELKHLQKKVRLGLESAEDEMLEGEEYRKVARGFAKVGTHW